MNPGERESGRAGDRKLFVGFSISRCSLGEHGTRSVTLSAPTCLSRSCAFPFDFRLSNFDFK